MNLEDLVQAQELDAVTWQGGVPTPRSLRSRRRGAS
jgi:hypothetical protein